MLTKGSPAAKYCKVTQKNLLGDINRLCLFFCGYPYVDTPPKQ